MIVIYYNTGDNLFVKKYDGDEFELIAAEQTFTDGYKKAIYSFTLKTDLAEEFNLTIGGVTDVSCKFILTENGLACRCNGKQWYSNYLNQILYGTCKIVKIPKPILDDIEKKYLFRFIRPFKERINYIVKLDVKDIDDEREYILIIYKEPYNTSIPRLMELPSFKKGAMYKGMKLGERYTLKELGL